MSYEDDRTKVIGRRDMPEDIEGEFAEFNNAYGEGAKVAGATGDAAPAGNAQENVQEPDELEYIEQEQQRKREAVRARAEYEAAQAKETAGAPKKKSKKGLVIALVIVLLLALAGGAYALLFSGEKTQELNVDLTSIMTEPDVSGYDGEGTLGEITVKQDAADALVKDLTSDEQKTNAANFFDTVEYTVDKSSGLSNGDAINIMAKYDEAAAQEAGLTVTKDAATYTVSGLKEKPKETTEASAINMPQWYRHISQEGDELAITCLLIAKEGTTVTLPIEFMYCYAGGAMSEMVDTSAEPNLTYGGTGYYMEDGSEAPTGTVTEVDDSHIKYSVRQYGDKFTINVNYSVNSDGSINVTSASGGEVPPPTGTYEAISSGVAQNLGGE